MLNVQGNINNANYYLRNLMENMENSRNLEATLLRLFLRVLEGTFIELIYGMV